MLLHSAVARIRRCYKLSGSARRTQRRRAYSFDNLVVATAAVTTVLVTINVQALVRCCRYSCVTCWLPPREACAAMLPQRLAGAIVGPL